MTLRIRYVPFQLPLHYLPFDVVLLVPCIGREVQIDELERTLSTVRADSEMSQDELEEELLSAYESLQLKDEEWIQFEDSATNALEELTFKLSEAVEEYGERLVLLSFLNGCVSDYCRTLRESAEISRKEAEFWRQKFFDSQLNSTVIDTYLPFLGIFDRRRSWSFLGVL